MISLDSFTAAFLTMSLLAAALPGQAHEPAKVGHEKLPKAEQKAQKPIAKLDAWPPLTKAHKDRLFACLSQFRKKKVELHQGARDRLIAIGAAGAPLLFQRVTDRPQNINEHLFLVFDKILTAEHAALMAQKTRKPGLELRRYLVERLCRFTDASMLPILRKMMTDKDPKIAFHASLGALALGESEAMTPVIAYTKFRWHEASRIVAEVLPTARSQAAGNWVFKAIAKASASDKMAGLRLARYLAVKEHMIILKGYLEASEHTVKKEAINALRVIHGEKPLETLSVFQVIGKAQEWRART